MATHKIEIPKGISPRDFFLSFAPKTYNAASEKMDLSAYQGFSLGVQFNITGPTGGKWGLRLSDGARIEVVDGEIPSPLVVYSFDDTWFGAAVEGRLPWIPLRVLCFPSALTEWLSPAQAHEQLVIMRGMEGRVDVHLTTAGGAVASLRAQLQGMSEPAVTFHLTERVIESVRAGERTVMEAFMASLFRVEGPIEFAMHVMALAPERSDSETSSAGSGSR